MRGNRPMTREELDMAAALRQALAFSNVAVRIPRQTVLAIARRLVASQREIAYWRRYHPEKS